DTANRILTRGPEGPPTYALPVEVRVLGPCELASASPDAGLAGPIERVVLAVLALAANRMVSTDRLVFDVWGDEPPDRAVASLQVRISRLGRALDRRDRIETRTAGYVLHLEPDELDANRFERLAEAGTTALAGGDPVRAADLLRDAL